MAGQNVDRAAEQMERRSRATVRLLVTNRSCVPYHGVAVIHRRERSLHRVRQALRMQLRFREAVAYEIAHRQIT